MNIQQINSEFSITDYLATQGFQPSRKKGYDWWYISPIRTAERTPSFKVNTRLNRWYDHGSGEGGKLFDLAMRLYPSASVREVIRHLTEPSLSSTIASAPALKLPGKPAFRNSPDAIAPPSPGIRIVEAKPLQENSPLVTYLRHRGISFGTANPYCREVDFSLNARHYQAIGFANRSGGYELRNSWFKGSSSPKDITYIDRGNDRICLLEGFMDFLSLLELRPHLKASSSFLVLNSLLQFNRSLDILSRHRQVLLYLDQDQAGRSVTERLLQSELPCRDESFRYQGYKDLNELLVSRQGQAKQLRIGLSHRRGASGKGL